MLLGDILKRLALRELSNLSMSDGGNISASARPKIIQALNSGLERLYSRFPFREKTLLIEMVQNYTEYRLIDKYAWSKRENGEELHYFIMDSEDEPYTGDLIKITGVWNSYGQKLPLNDISNSSSLFTPAPDTLLVQRPKEGDILSITYQALPDEIPLDSPDTVEFYLPRLMRDTLALVVAAYVFQDIGTQEALGKSQILFSEYDDLCTEIEIKDLLNTSVTGSGEKFARRGWA